MPKAMTDFNALYKKISPMLKKIARGYNGQGHFFDDDDLYQEMSIYLWNNFKHGQPCDLNESYIVRGCNFHILNYLRKEREKAVIFSLEEVVNEETKPLKDILAVPGPPIDRYLEGKLIFAEIRNNGFSRREKEVLAHLLAGLTTREAGQRLGISHVMVSKYKKRIIKKWRKKVTIKARNLLNKK